VLAQTAVASAITGVITDPRDLQNKYSATYPRITEPEQPTVETDLLVAPPSGEDAAGIELEKLGLRVVLARDYARIHWQSLANFGVLALEIDEAPTSNSNRRTRSGSASCALVESGEQTEVEVDGKGTILARHGLSERQHEYVLAEGTTNWMRTRP
jgi:hypothetical protein